MFPQIFRVRQQFDADGIREVGPVVRQALRQLKLDQRIQPGASVAITAGSRGIAQIASVMTHLVAGLQQEFAARPFIIPAMGSHGGATAESQKGVLSGLGITEATCGCPIHSSLDTITIDHTDAGVPVYADRVAWEADYVLLVNRIKPHTDFFGPIQSGLVKMLLLGLGKYQGAQTYHQAFQNYGFSEIVQQVAPRILQSGKVLGGIALVENASKELTLVEGVLPDHIMQREAELLKFAAEKMARLPISEADLLIIDQIGKNISGTGMDTNVIGRKGDDHRAAPDEYPKIRHIAVRGLAPASNGNALGIGIAEYCLQRAVDAVNRTSTRINCVTSVHPTAGMIPLTFDSDAEMIQAALRSTGLRPTAEARVVWIRNTAELTELACSAAYWEELQDHPRIECSTPPEPFPFQENGMLPELPAWWHPT
ncbi:MAG: lactate racemase domain-containing protein [Planctomycetota bacterium]|nr:lactate racemase domain-containing protein [Planctomycetota bacterium]